MATRHHLCVYGTGQARSEGMGCQNFTEERAADGESGVLACLPRSPSGMECVFDSSPCAFKINFSICLLMGAILVPVHIMLMVLTALLVCPTNSF